MSIKACTKVRHASKEAAVIAQRKTGGNVQLNAYFCKRCKAWHLGNSGNPLRKMDRIGQLLAKHAKSHPTA